MLNIGIALNSICYGIFILQTCLGGNFYLDHLGPIEPPIQGVQGILPGE